MKTVLCTYIGMCVGLAICLAGLLFVFLLASCISLVEEEKEEVEMEVEE